MKTNELTELGLKLGELSERLRVIFSLLDSSTEPAVQSEVYFIESELYGIATEYGYDQDEVANATLKKRTT